MQPGEAARLEAAKNSYADINCSRLHFYLVPLPLSLFSSFLPFGAHLWPIFTGHGFKMRSPGAQNTFSPSRRKLIRERTHPSNAFIRGGKERRSPGATRCTSRVIYRRDCVGKSIDHSGEKKRRKNIRRARVSLSSRFIKISHERSCLCFVIFLPFRVPFCHPTRHNDEKQTRGS